MSKRARAGFTRRGSGTSTRSGRITGRALALALCIPVVSIGSMTLLSRRPGPGLRPIGATDVTDWGKGSARVGADAVAVAPAVAGAGWRAARPVADAGTACAPWLGRDPSEPAGHASADLVHDGRVPGTGTRISIRTTVFADVGSAQWGVATLQGPPVLGCLDRAVRTQLGPHVAGGVLPASRFAPGAGAGNALVGTTGEYVLHAPAGPPQAVHTGTVTVRTGPVATTIRFVAIGEPVDPTALRHVVDEVAARQRG